MVLFYPLAWEFGRNFSIAAIAPGVSMLHDPATLVDRGGFMRAKCTLVLATLLVASLFIAAPATAGLPGPPGSGYWMLDNDGNVYAFGASPFCGSPSELGEFWGADIVATPDGWGYWVLDARGAVIGVACEGMPDDHFNSYYGDSEFVDLLGPDEFAVSMSPTPNGEGYWVFTDRGHVFAFGNAQFFGSLAGVALNGPILDSVATPSGNGYWMVGSDGGVFSFGDAQFYGSMGGRPLNEPVMAMAPDPDGLGYWLVASDGGIFAFHAPFYGSTGGIRLNQPISGMVASPTGQGYLMAAFDGGVFTFGDVPFHGSLGGQPPAADVYSIAVMP